MKQPRATTSTPRNPGLEREKVVDAALDLLDEVGIAQLTLRRLADKLNVKAAALYWHFQNKQDLINEMAMRVVCGAQRQHKGVRLEHMPWQDLLRRIGRSQRLALLSRRDGAQLVASADLAAMPLMEGMEVVLQHLHAQGFPSELALLSIINISRFGLGCVFEEQADPRPKHDGLAVRRRMLQESADRFPVAAQTLEGLADKRALTPERQFEHGLGLLIAGIEHQLQKHKG